MFLTLEKTSSDRTVVSRTGSEYFIFGYSQSRKRRRIYLLLRPTWKKSAWVNNRPWSSGSNHGRYLSKSVRFEQQVSYYHNGVTVCVLLSSSSFFFIFYQHKLSVASPGNWTRSITAARERGLYGSGRDIQRQTTNVDSLIEYCFVYDFRNERWTRTGFVVFVGWSIKTPYSDVTSVGVYFVRDFGLDASAKLCTSS